ncbi:FadR/GntR family transcriptional regulator [Nonomuraea guangzhouensis]|uniref:FadR/GntR family transcriptional regulator n=1 Tax=Nonomuraea guangzhouensis TaxID=1291555 RepID=A0ABW4GUJ2_9ACTN|nr:FadR/GntR family transcriptional regulator [Nonomuraea guangzhouensis]
MIEPRVKATRRNLSASIADDLLFKIKSGQLPPGSKVPGEKELMAAYGVGRNTVREAVQSLVTMGYLDVRPRVGARVTSIPVDEAVEAEAISALLAGEAVGDIYELRRVLETEIAKRAATEATPADLEAITLALEDYERAHRDGHGAYRADVAFHAALAVASHNVAFRNVLEGVGDLLLNARQLTDHLPGAISLALKEHTEILRAVEQRDPEKAHHAMKVHMDTSVEAWKRAQRLFVES